MKPYSVFEKKVKEDGKFYFNFYPSNCVIETIDGALDSNGVFYSLCEDYSDPAVVSYEFDSLEELARNMDACIEDAQKYFPEVGK